MHLYRLHPVGASLCCQPLVIVQLTPAGLSLQSVVQILMQTREPRQTYTQMLRMT